jgi:protein-L-isoaspartate(D-aspartate) O-methyltransferase
MTTAAPGQSDPAAEQLRDAMVRSLIELDAARDPRVIAAFRAVPRHLATPGLDLARAYGAEFAAVAKTDATGVDISSVSAPRVQAMQIEQAQIQPGMTVLEVGSGGPNAAYLAEMVGAEGHVVAMDIDPDVTARATGFLRAAGYGNVTVLTIKGVCPDEDRDRGPRLPVGCSGTCSRGRRQRRAPAPVGAESSPVLADQISRHTSGRRTRRGPSPDRLRLPGEAPAN